MSWRKAAFTCSPKELHYYNELRSRIGDGSRVYSVARESKRTIAQVNAPTSAM